MSAKISSVNDATTATKSEAPQGQTPPSTTSRRRLLRGALALGALGSVGALGAFVHTSRRASSSATSRGWRRRRPTSMAPA